jgi:hypothetical protein
LLEAVKVKTPMTATKLMMRMNVPPRLLEKCVSRNPRWRMPRRKERRSGAQKHNARASRMIREKHSSGSC